MSTFDYHEFNKTIAGVGMMLKAIKERREEEFRRRKAEEQDRERQKLTSNWESSRFMGIAEDAEFEEV